MKTPILDKNVDQTLEFVGGDLKVRDILHYAAPQPGQSTQMSDWKYTNLPNVFRGLEKIAIAMQHDIPTFFGLLWAKKITVGGGEIDYGIVSTRVVTTAGVNAIVDAFQNSFELETFKYHGLGSGSTAEASANTALVTEYTTELSVNSTRATGTLTEGATANVFRTVATNTFDATVAIREHGIFSDATVGQGVLLDRSVFSVINLESGESLQTQYDFTITAGG